jgi:hypothetical protein
MTVVVDSATGRAHIAVRPDQVAQFAKMIKNRYVPDWRRGGIPQHQAGPGAASSESGRGARSPTRRAIG